MNGGGGVTTTTTTGKPSLISSGKRSVSAGTGGPIVKVSGSQSQIIQGPNGSVTLMVSSSPSSSNTLEASQQQQQQHHHHHHHPHTPNVSVPVFISSSHSNNNNSNSNSSACSSPSSGKRMGSKVTLSNNKDRRTDSSSGPNKDGVGVTVMLGGSSSSSSNVIIGKTGGGGGPSSTSTTITKEAKDVTLKGGTYVHLIINAFWMYK
jgi:hypothetical protein